jgi:uncharacterized integral membrane protein (TIGR00697 family)
MTRTHSPTDNSYRPQARLGLACLFITALLAAQLTASKLVGIPTGVELPLIGSSVLVPAAAFAYALTFFASDCYAEVFGKAAATRLIRTAFAANILLLTLVAIAIWLPHGGGVPQSEFATVLGASGNIVAASLSAYLLSQHLDVSLFHRLRDRHGEEHLWLRNVASTATSQFIDTAVFILGAFAIFPTLLGIGTALPGAVLVQLVVGQYVLKLSLAVSDTPFVYAVRSLLEDDRSLTRSQHSPSD